MTRKTILSLAATLVAATTFSGLAEAGNGVRLNFGGPLGSFEAHPSRGGAAASSAYSAPKAKCAPKASSQYASHHATPKAAPQKKQEIASTPRRIVEDEPKVARTKRVSKPKTEIASVETTAEAAEETVLTGSKALAAQDAAEPATTTATETTASTGTTADTKTETASIQTETKEPATEAQVAETEKDAAAEATKIAEAKDVGCKKFIPAIGVTVSVGCGK